MGSSPFARTKKAVEHSTAFFVRASGLMAFVPLCHCRDISPGRIYVSDVWSLALAQNSRRLPRPLSVRASGLAVSFPSVTNVTSPRGEYTSLTFGRSHALRTAEDSLDHFSVRASGLAVSLPSVTGVTAPQGEYTSPTFGRSHALRTAEDSLDHFLREPRTYA